MKMFHYHREFWLDFHFWLLVLLLVAVAMMTQDPLLILLQVFQPQVSNRQHPVGSCHFNWDFYRDTRLYIDLFLLAGLLEGPFTSTDIVYWILLGAFVGSIGFVFVVKEKPIQKTA